MFDCQKCGQCCEGSGGIVLSGKDLARLAAFLRRGVDDTRREYCEYANGKLKIRSGHDGCCIFFRAGLGCVVHEGKPDICRAWPFFRGNLVDAHSFYMARDFCPGIARNASFEMFVRAGMEYLRRHDLLAKGQPGEANALKVGELAISAESAGPTDLGI